MSIVEVIADSTLKTVACVIYFIVPIVVVLLICLMGLDLGERLIEKSILFGWSYVVIGYHVARKMFNSSWVCLFIMRLYR